MSNVVTIVMLKHLATADNRSRLRPRDQDLLPEDIARWQENSKPLKFMLCGLASVYAAVYCPTTKRHLWSAFLYAASCNLPPPIPDCRINNVDYGVYKGRPVSETPNPLAHIDTPYEGGTSWTYVATQWRSFMEEVVRRHSGQIILLAGQSGAGPKMLAHVCEGTPLLEAITKPPARRVWHYRESDNARVLAVS